MADKGVVALIGLIAGLLLAAAYLGAPFVGAHMTALSVTLLAACLAFCAAAMAIALVLLPKPKKKKLQEIRIRDLPAEAYERFPTDGPRPVVRPDMQPKDIAAIRENNTTAYENKDIFVKIKKGKGVFNPNVLKQIFAGLKSYRNFVHVLLVNEHDEYIGYLPAMYARTYMIGDTGELLIARYITDVLDNPNLANLREINGTMPDTAGRPPELNGRTVGDGFLVKKCVGLSQRECISDESTVFDAIERVTADHVRGLVVYRGHRNRKPVGVLWDEDLLRYALKRLQEG